MKRKLKIAVCMPKTNSFYMSVLFAIKQGFEENEAEVLPICQHLEQETLIEFCNQYKPDILFEMNRSRHEIPNLPKKIKHIAWIVDLPGKNPSYYNDSEITYYMVAPWSKHYNANKKSMVDWLPPGAATNTYYYNELSPNSDFSFVGHIPAPWTKEESSRPLFQYNSHEIVFSDYFNYLADDWPSHIMDNLEQTSSKNLASQILERLYKQSIEISDQTLCYDIAMRTYRILNRSTLINIALKYSKSLNLYGPNNWKKWPQYRSYYKYFVHDSNEIRRIYQRSKINLHEGLDLNFRTFDCMASGGVLCFMHRNKDKPFGSMYTYFEPNEHYIPLYDDNYEALDYWIANKKLREKIAVNVSQLVKEQHSWKVRTKKIMDDLWEI